MTSLRGRRAIAPACLAAGAAVALILACHESVNPLACYDAGGQAYPFWLNGDTSKVFHWPASYMPVRVYAESVGDLPANVRTAMTLWTGAFRCHELSLTAAADSTHADIIVRNPPVLPVAPRAAHLLRADSVGACEGVTQVELDTVTGRSITGPIHSYVTPLPGDSVAIASCYHFVTAHELGHALGIFAHSPDTSDLMYGQPRRLALSVNDRFTIQVLYHLVSRIAPPPRK